MKVLMFGWEFPPKIYGGLAVASYGITKGLSLQGDVETTFCMPKPTGEEEDFLKIVGMNQVPIVWRDVDYNYLKSDAQHDAGRLLFFPRPYLFGFLLYARQ